MDKIQTPDEQPIDDDGDVVIVSQNEEARYFVNFYRFDECEIIQILFFQHQSFGTSFSKNSLDY